MNTNMLLVAQKSTKQKNCSYIAVKPENQSNLWHLLKLPPFIQVKLVRRIRRSLIPLDKDLNDVTKRTEAILNQQRGNFKPKNSICTKDIKDVLDAKIVSCKVIFILFLLYSVSEVREGY